MWKCIGRPRLPMLRAVVRLVDVQATGSTIWSSIVGTSCPPGPGSMKNMSPSVLRFSASPTASSNARSRQPDLPGLREAANAPREARCRVPAAGRGVTARILRPQLHLCLRRDSAQWPGCDRCSSELMIGALRGSRPARHAKPFGSIRTPRPGPAESPVPGAVCRPKQAQRPRRTRRPIGTATACQSASRLPKPRPAEPTPITRWSTPPTCAGRCGPRCRPAPTGRSGAPNRRTGRRGGACFRAVDLVTRWLQHRRVA